MTRAEIARELFPVLGVYGIWLAEHGDKLDKSNPLVKAIMSRYAMFRTRQEHVACMLLFESINEFCDSTGYQQPMGYVPKSVFVAGNRVWLG